MKITTHSRCITPAYTFTTPHHIYRKRMPPSVLPLSLCLYLHLPSTVTYLSHGGLHGALVVDVQRVHRRAQRPRVHLLVALHHVLPVLVLGGGGLLEQTHPHLALAAIAVCNSYTTTYYSGSNMIGFIINSCFMHACTTLHWVIT